MCGLDGWERMHEDGDEVIKPFPHDEMKEKLFRFLELPVTKSVQTFFHSHTHAEGKKDDPYGKDDTYRHTKEVGSQWQNKLPQDVVANIADACKPLLKRLDLL